MRWWKISYYPRVRFGVFRCGTWSEFLLTENNKHLESGQEEGKRFMNLIWRYFHVNVVALSYCWKHLKASKVQTITLKFKSRLRSWFDQVTSLHFQPQSPDRRLLDHYRKVQSQISYNWKTQCSSGGFLIDSKLRKKRVDGEGIE